MNDLRHYCRACKSITVENFINLSSDYFGTTYGVLYFELTGIEVTDPTFSEILCQTCVRALIFSHEFTQMCKKTQKELEAFLSVLREREGNVPIDDTEKVEETKESECDVDQTNAELTTKTKMVQEVDVEAETNMRKEEVRKEPEKARIQRAWICHFCEDKYYALSHFKHHLKTTHKEMQCKRCKTILHGSLSHGSHLKLFHVKPKATSLTCKICDKTFTTASILKRHIQTVHETIRKFRCQICHKSFQNNTHLKRHQSVHSTNRPFTCEICSLSFKTEVILKHHLNGHTASCDHICDICGSKFKTASYLKTHQETHSETRDFTCEKCNKSFKMMKTLRDHIQRSHGEKEKIDCHICGKKFKNKVTLNNHLRNHYAPGVKCPECKDSFMNKYVLKDHIAAQHENARNFVCKFEECGYGYYTSSHLNYHIKAVHLGVAVRKSKS